MSAASAGGSRVRNVLVRAPNWIGDQVMAYPFFHYLRAAYPTAKITSVCVSWVEDMQFRNLVDDVFVLPRPASGSLVDRFRAIDRAALALRDRSGGWDLALSLPNSFSAAWLIYRAGAARRRGYKGDGRSFLLNEGVEWDASPSRHRAQAYVDLLDPEHRPSRPVREFWGEHGEDDLDEFVSGEVGEFPAEKAWPSVETIKPPSSPYWVLAPGSKAVSRQWPADRYAALARHVAETTGWMGIIVGSRAESEIADFLRQDASLNLRDFTGKGAVTALWPLFRNARFTVCNESGLAHVAALCGSPVQIVCGAADPRRTRPLGPGKVQVRVNPVECWPCEKNTCFQKGEKHIQCLMGIESANLWEDIRRGLRPDGLGPAAAEETTSG